MQTEDKTISHAAKLTFQTKLTNGNMDDLSRQEEKLYTLNKAKQMKQDQESFIYDNKKKRKYGDPLQRQRKSEEGFQNHLVLLLPQRLLHPSTENQNRTAMGDTKNATVLRERKGENPNEP